MPIEEAGGYCDYCQRPVLGRRQGTNHVLFALLTLFSCGLFGLVWLLVVMVSSSAPYFCPTCGRMIRRGADTPLSPTQLSSAPPPPLSPEERAQALAQNATRERRYRSIALGIVGAVIVILGTLFWIAGQEKRQPLPRPYVSAGKSPPASPSRSPASTSQAAHLTGNLAHDILVGLPEARRRRHLAQVVASADEPCATATRTFLQGLDQKKNAIWNVTCDNGRSYSVTVNNDSRGSTRVLSCAMLAAVADVRCFTKF
jgi:hypothetical protein